MNRIEQLVKVSKRIIGEYEDFKERQKRETDEFFYIEDYIEEFCGEGSSRIAFSINDEYVIKITKNTLNEHFYIFNRKNDGISQTLREIKTNQNFQDTELSDFLNPILYSGTYKGRIFTIQKKLAVVEEVLYQQDEDYIEELNLALEKLGYTNQEICQTLYDFEHLCKVAHISYDDILLNIANIGITDNGEIKIIDYGFIKSWLFTLFWL